MRHVAQASSLTYRLCVRWAGASSLSLIAPISTASTTPRTSTTTSTSTWPRTTSASCSSPMLSRCSARQERRSSCASMPISTLAPTTRRWLARFQTLSSLPASRSLRPVHATPAMHAASHATHPTRPPLHQSKRQASTRRRRLLTPRCQLRRQPRRPHCRRQYHPHWFLRQRRAAAASPPRRRRELCSVKSARQHVLRSSRCALIAPPSLRAPCCVRPSRPTWRSM